MCIVNRNRNAKSVEELHCAFITGKKFDVKNKLKEYCKECGGSALCIHDKAKS